MRTIALPIEPAPRGWSGWSSIWPRDVLIALGAGIVTILGTFAAANSRSVPNHLEGLGIALLIAPAASLVFRRRAPATVLVFAHGTTLLYWVLGFPGGPVFLPMVVAFFTAVMHDRRVVAWISLGFGFLAFPWLPYLISDESAPGVTGILALGAWLLVLGAVAEGLRMRRDRAAEAERLRKEETRRRASEERLRIARDLHDVLAHNISLINVQAGVALHLIDEKPEQARTALAAIKEASRDALRELRTALDVLRRTDDAAPRSPAPGLDSLDELVSRTSAAGVQVRTEIAGEARPLPASVDVTAYRIIQEALTNVVRHAGKARAIVRVTYGAADLSVYIEDDGVGPVPAGAVDRPGQGIAGMRERAAALGGQLDAGPRPEGGFRVSARLPLGGPV